MDGRRAGKEQSKSCQILFGMRLRARKQRDVIFKINKREKQTNKREFLELRKRELGGTCVYLLIPSNKTQFIRICSFSHSLFTAQSCELNDRFLSRNRTKESCILKSDSSEVITVQTLRTRLPAGPRRSPRLLQLRKHRCAALLAFLCRQKKFAFIGLHYLINFT